MTLKVSAKLISNVLSACAISLSVAVLVSNNTGAEQHQLKSFEPYNGHPVTFYGVDTGHAFSRDTVDVSCLTEEKSKSLVGKKVTFRLLEKEGEPFCFVEIG